MVIKFRLEKFEKALVFQVLEMREDLRGCDEYVCENGISVESSNVPDITTVDDDTIYLQGDDVEEDLRVSVAHFESDEERDRCQERILQALSAWATYHAKDAQPPKVAPSIFIF